LRRLLYGLAVFAVAGTARAQEPAPLPASPPPFEAAAQPFLVPIDTQLAPCSTEQNLALQGMLGTQTVVRGQYTVSRGDRHFWVAEAYGGLAFTSFAVGIAGGAGCRVIFEPGRNGNILVAPGVGVMVVSDFGQTTGTGLMADVDVSRRFIISPRCSSEFGVHLGVGVCVSGRDGDDDVTGYGTMTFGLFSGFRF
jgi:hypothetical protein